MKQFMIYCCAGTGGLFLTTVFAQVLGLNVQAKFSASGNAHDMGRGNWRGAQSVCFIGDHWTLNYRPGSVLYYAHTMPGTFLKDNPGVTVIKVIADPQDYRKVTELYVKKAWPDIWSQEEYNKWAGPDYPPYSATNIPDSDIIVSDLINDFEKTVVQHWHDLNRHVEADHTVNFRTIMGIDRESLLAVVCDITSSTATLKTQCYVSEYQHRNQELYLLNYV